MQHKDRDTIVPPKGITWYRSPDNPHGIPPEWPPDDWRRMGQERRTDIKEAYRKARSQLYGEDNTHVTYPVINESNCSTSESQNDHSDYAFSMPCLNETDERSPQVSETETKKADVDLDLFPGITLRQHNNKHREKNPYVAEAPFLGFVARAVTKTEVAKTPEAKAACKKERDRLREKGVWDGTEQLRHEL